MFTRRTRIAAAGLAVAATVGALSTGPASAKAGDVVRTGNCSAASDWKLKLGPRDGHIETEFQVDSNIAGQTWNVKLFHNGTRVLRTQATTTAPSGSFDVRLQIPDAQGRDVVDATATNPSTHETCAAQARV
jgi:hypothetical protein